MIVNYRTISLRSENSYIDKPIVAYRGDRDIEIYFSIVEFPYSYTNTAVKNVLDIIEDAYFSQLVIQVPNGGKPLFSEVTEIVDKQAVLKITKEMIDEVNEVGDYTFQIRLFDGEMNARFTIPPVENGLRVKEPIASEDGITAIVDMGIVGQSIVENEPITRSFDSNGYYEPTDWNKGDLITAAKLNKLETSLKKVSAISKHSTVLLDSVADLKRHAGQIGDVVSTSGYYSKGDGGGANYIIEARQQQPGDDGLIIELDNGLNARLVHDGTIYAKQFGVKLDGVTDDTQRMNEFLKLMGEAKLVVENGTCLISDTLYCKGTWRKDNTGIGFDAKIDTLEFINSNIKYVGQEGKCSILFYNHFKSLIKGLVIRKDSSKNNYVNFIGCWYSKISDFEIGNLCINKDLNILSQNLKLETNSSLDNIFENGYIYDGCIYLDSTGKNQNGTDIYINNQMFRHITMKSYNSEYSIYLKGGHFQKLYFDKCDISYSTKGTFNITEQATSSRSSIVLDACYLDSAIPLFKDLDLKGFKLSKINCIEASANPLQKTMMATRDYLSIFDMGISSMSGNHLPFYAKNIVINGDLSCGVKNNNWLYLNANMNNNYNISPNGENFKLELTWNDNQGIAMFKSIEVPLTSIYTGYIVVRKVSGSGRLQTDYKSLRSDGSTIQRIYNAYDLNNVPDGTELVLVGRESLSVEKGQKLELAINKPSANEANNLKLEILEVGIVAGSLVQMGLPLFDSCKIDKYGTTLNRPTNKKVGFTYYDTTLNKLIVWDGSNYRDMNGIVI